MEKNLFKNKKNVLWTVMIRVRGGPEASGCWALFWAANIDSLHPERLPDGIYFCIFVISCYSQLIDIKIYIIKRRWNAKNEKSNKKIKLETANVR